MKYTANNSKFLREMKDRYALMPVCYAQIARTMNEQGEDAARAKAAKIDASIAAARAEWQSS